jgi:methionyl-tRNA synthetase
MYTMSFSPLLAARLDEPLLDLSVSRTTFAWGIPVPEGFDSKHVMYVWFDALSNYLSGVHGTETGAPPHLQYHGTDVLEAERLIDRVAGHELASFWPAQVHVIGKDIIWFHCVIWPTILMSAGLPLPQR